MCEIMFVPLCMEEGERLQRHQGFFFFVSLMEKSVEYKNTR